MIIPFRHRSLTAVTSITLKKILGFQKKMCFNVWSHSMTYALYCKRKKQCLIDRFINRIGFLQGLYVFNGMSFCKLLSE